MLVNGSLFSLFCLVIICWSWDRPIVMRFIRICFDHYSFSVFSSYFFWQHNPCTKSLMNGRVQRDFAHWKALKSIQELTNCTVKKGDWWYWSCGFRRKWVHCTTEFKWISIACSKRISFEAFCCFEKKRQKRTKKKKSNFAVRLVLRPMLSYLIVFKPWRVPCLSLSQCNCVSFL